MGTRTHICPIILSCTYVKKVFVQMEKFPYNVNQQDAIFSIKISIVSRDMFRASSLLIIRKINSV